MLWSAGLSRDRLHKRRHTGGKQRRWRKKRAHELARQPADTKLSSEKRVRRVRVRGGNYKFRALRLHSGNFSWGSEAITAKSRIVNVVYNATNNELVRTQTLVKNAIVQIDAQPFKNWYRNHYKVEIGRKRKGEGMLEPEPQEADGCNRTKRKYKTRQTKRSELDPRIDEQFATGRLLACISSRPGQSGRVDGYILEGRELEFYLRKLQSKKRGAK